MVKNQPQYFFLCVETASLNRKGKPGLLTRWRIKKAVRLAKSLERSDLKFCYAVGTACRDPFTQQRNTEILLKELFSRHPGYRGEVVTLPRGVVLASKVERRKFFSESAKVRGAELMLF